MKNKAGVGVQKPTTPLRKRLSESNNFCSEIFHGYELMFDCSR